MFIISASGLSDAAAAAVYPVARSLRFNSGDGTHVSRTPVASSNRDVWTFHCWVKKSRLGGTILAAYVDVNNYTLIQTTSAGLFEYINVLAGVTTYRRTSTAAVVNVTGWVALTVSMNTVTPLMRLWVGNTEITSWSIIEGGVVGADTQFNHTTAHRLGRFNATSEFDGYMAHVHLIDGLALDQTSFIDGSGLPKAYVGAYGTNGFKLDFADNSAATAATLGKDISGNGNNYTPTAFNVAAGVTNDSLVDSPTEYGTETSVGGEVRGNYCMLDRTLTASGFTIPTLTDGNLHAAISSAVNTVALGTLTVPAAVVPFPTARWFFEATLTASNGVASTRVGVYSHTNAKFCSWALNGDVYINDLLSGGSHPGMSYTTGDVLGFGFLITSGTASMELCRNGTSLVVLGGGLVFGAWTPFVSLATFAGQWDLNFGARPFAYPRSSVSEYKTICSTNI